MRLSVLATGTAAVLIAATLHAPHAGARLTQGTQISRGPVHLPIALMASIDEAPTTLGIADSNLYNLSQADINKTLDELQALGVRDIRIAVPWVYVQAGGPSSYDWAKLDYVVNAAADRDMGILGVISATPLWAGAPLNGHPNNSVYAGFASAVATRYAGKIDSYEIWNEPNGKNFWDPVSASAYTELLKAAYPAIKAADPNARVIGGVLGAVSTIPGLSQSPITFVKQMYDSGAHGYFDALSYHPYHYTTPFSMGDVAEAPINQMAAIRAMMIANGDADAKVWATEYGLPTSSVSQTQQAAFIHDFVASWQNVDGAGPIFIYTTRDTNTGGFDDEENFGLFQTNWTKKEAADTVAGLITDLADGSAEPFDVTPYLPQDGFFQGVAIFIKQVINQLLLVPKFVVQVVSSIITAVVQFVGTAIGTLTGAIKPAASVSAPDLAAPAASSTVPTQTLTDSPVDNRESTVKQSAKQQISDDQTSMAAADVSEREAPAPKSHAETAGTTDQQPTAQSSGKQRSGLGSSARTNKRVSTPAS